MPAPVYNNIRSVSSGTAGTGAFTPGAAVTGNEPWSNVPSGWMGQVRFDDGAAASREHCFWNGTTLSRGTNQRVWSTTGAMLSLTSAATATMVVDANEVMSHLGGVPWVGAFGAINTSVSSMRGGTITEIGTASNATIAATNLISEQPRRQYTSLTTANAQAGWVSPAAWAVYHPTAGRGGFEYIARFGVTALPTGPRLFAGMTNFTFNGVTAEPSAHVSAMVAFAKDSTDSSIQFLTNDGTGGGTKTDTSVSFVAGELYEVGLWMEPGGTRAFGYIYKLGIGTIWYGTVTTDIPAAAATMRAECLTGLSSTTGTAAVIHMSSMMVRGGT